MTAATRRIKEVKNGWLDTDSGHVFKTAANVLRSAKREGRRDAKGNGISAVTIEWESTTAIGARIVRAIQGA